MKKLSLAFLVVLVSVLALVSLSTTALAAPATKVPFSATLQITEILGAKRVWTDEEGILHLRGWNGRGTITGDISGLIEIIENVNMDTSSGYGNAQVKGVITVGSEEAYRMSADVTMEGYGATISGTFVIQGMGSYKGIHVTGTLSTSGTDQAVLTGTKLTTKP
jgi:hypothetical protein